LVFANQGFLQTPTSQKSIDDATPRPISPPDCAIGGGGVPNAADDAYPPSRPSTAPKSAHAGRFIHRHQRSNRTIGKAITEAVTVNKPNRKANGPPPITSKTAGNQTPPTIRPMSARNTAWLSFLQPNARVERPATMTVPREDAAHEFVAAAPTRC